MNDPDSKFNSDFIADEMQGLQRRDLLLLGGLSALWALAFAMFPKFLFGANREPGSSSTLLKGKSTRFVSHRMPAVGHEGFIPHPGAAAKQ